LRWRENRDSEKFEQAAADTYNEGMKQSLADAGGKLAQTGFGVVAKERLPPLRWAPSLTTML
jgi:hypothetical protein